MFYGSMYHGKTAIRHNETVFSLLFILLNRFKYIYLVLFQYLKLREIMQGRFSNSKVRKLLRHCEWNEGQALSMFLKSQ